MRFTEVVTTEAQISSIGLPHLQQQPFEFPVSGDADLNLKGMVCHRRDGLATYYYQESFPKERIVIHFTAGHLRGDLVTLMGEIHVSVPYVIARDGTIYQLFDPALWSYHLGPGAIGGNKTQSRRTIGIELSNYGPLLRNGNDLETIYSSATARDVYCSLDDYDQYLNLSELYRNRNYYASFTDAQYDSLILLIRHLTHQFEIPREFLAPDTRHLASNAVLSHEGIVSHVNYRADGKWDVGPAFDWDRVIAGAQAGTFKPLNPLEHKIQRKQRELAKEKDILEQQRKKVNVLKEELTALKAERIEPVSRGVFVPFGITSQVQANEVFSSDRQISADHGEEDMEPGYDPMQIADFES